MNIAVVLAGGSGTRLGLDKPKQFLKVAGKTVLEHTIDVFQNSKYIDEVAVVIHREYMDCVSDMVIKNRWGKVRKILSGGNERYESSLSAIKAYENYDGGSTYLIFHDAVRPLVSNRIIRDTIEALTRYDAVDVAIPTADTIIELDIEKKFIANIPSRSYLQRGQTPQAFSLNTIKNAYELALKDPHFSTTDDCGIVKKYMPDVPVYVVAGEERNIKLTYPEDIYLLDKLFQIQSTRADNNITLEQLRGKCIVVFGGSSGIGKDIYDIAAQNNAIVYSFSRKNGIDIANINDVKKALGMVYKEVGKIDYVINSAAILNREPIMHLSEAEIYQIISTNYMGAVNTTIAAFEYLRESKGQVLQFTSSSYTRGRAFYALYSSSKAAVVNFVQAIAEEWDTYGIKINCINPQRTKTPMRTTNFGIEDESTLLKSKDVANESLKTILSDLNGEVIDVKLT